MSRWPQLLDSREVAPLRHETPGGRRGIEDTTLTIPRAAETGDQASTTNLRNQELSPRRPEPDRIRSEYRERNRTYRLRDSEITALVHIGAFRAVNEEDLTKYGYDGNKARMESDLRNLSQQSLIERHTLPGFKGDTPTMVAL